MFRPVVVDESVSVVSQRDLGRRGKRRETHVLDLLHRKVRIRRDSSSSPLKIRPYVDNDHDRLGRIPLDHLVDFEVRSAKFGTGVVPTDELLAGCRREGKSVGE
jgi:hypothetical protein